MTDKDGMHKSVEDMPIRRDGVRKRAIDAARSRVMIAGSLFAFCFVVIAFRLVQLGFAGWDEVAQAPAPLPPNPPRGEIVDRNGKVLATNLEVPSLYADASLVPDPAAAARQLVEILPDVNERAVREKLASDRRFVWIKRKISPRQQWAVNALGIPGLSFRQEIERIYPQGRLASHAIGFVNVDNKGMAGIEQAFDTALSDPVDPETITTSLDVRVQHALRTELADSMATFNAKGAAGLVMDVNTGEILALVSLPDFDPHHPGEASKNARFNHVTQGVYEMGSPFKTFTIAAALENGTISLRDEYDASKPIHVARYTIRDFHPENRTLSVPEIFLHSSNIGAAKIAMDLGGDAQTAFFRDLGLMSPPEVELSGLGRPLYPARWRKINTMTAAFGHGIAVTPLQLAAGTSAIVNGGKMRPATLLSAEGRRLPEGKRVVSQGVSRTMRSLLRLVVAEGTGENADAAGYRVGGKTGTAEKQQNGRYARKALISSFVGIFPSDAPRYLVFAMLDEPKGTKDTFGYATGGWTAAPVVGKVISRVGPVLGIYPEEDAPGQDGPALLASFGGEAP